MKNSFSNFSSAQLFRKTSITIVFLSVLMASGVAFSSVSSQGEITRGDFIKLLAKNHPENVLLPTNHSQMSGKAMFPQVTNRLKSRGVNVLENKSPDGLLTQQEFIRITYAFSGGEPNKSLFEQKLFLKNAKIISSTDIGITTGMDGTVYQTHKGQSKKKQIELAGPVFMDDQFETDYSSKALFTFDDASTLTMSEDTVININKHVYNPDKNLRETLIKASIGWVRFKVTKDMTNGSSFKVVTPTATAGVRGTEFAVITNREGKSTFVVLEGKIETFSNKTNGKGSTFFISAGEMQDFFPDGSSSPVKNAPARFLAKVVNKTTKPIKMASFQGVEKGLAKKAAMTSMKTAKAQENAAKFTEKATTMADKFMAKANRFADKDPEKAARFAKKAAEMVDKFTAKADKFMVKSSAKLTAKDSAKGAAKDSAKLAAKGSAKIAAKASAKSAAKNSAVAAAKNSAVAAAKNSAVAAAKNSAVAAAKNSAKNTAKNSAKNTAKQVAKEIGNAGGGII
ncbi:MAG: hypothetical protein NPINA01_09400 [Nitrospinaceae bacterium]|nr:MAG: hypothetical protein NPINA01_09400 [Nitrospinaceae bacterium]